MFCSSWETSLQALALTLLRFPLFIFFCLFLCFNFICALVLFLSLRSFCCSLVFYSITPVAPLTEVRVRNFFLFMTFSKALRLKRRSEHLFCAFRGQTLKGINENWLVVTSRFALTWLSWFWCGFNAHTHTHTHHVPASVLVLVILYWDWRLMDGWCLCRVGDYVHMGCNNPIRQYFS